MDLTTLSFLILGCLTVILSVTLITRRSPVAAAVSLVGAFVCLAAMYGLLEAHFAAVIQIIVYAGAIMVVFVFVIMLLNLPPEELRFGRLTPGEGLIALVGVIAAVALTTKVTDGALQVVSSNLPSGIARPPYYADSENLKNVAALLFTDYLWAFEVVSFLILVAIIGAIVIAKKRGRHVKPS